jgi:hypothetical protein
VCKLPQRTQSPQAVFRRQAKPLYRAFWIAYPSMTLLEAFNIAARLHTGQTDKAGRPYVEHLTRVFLRVQAAGGDHFQQIAALLHDSVEDAKTSADELRQLGIPDEAISIVLALTKRRGQSYEDYLAGLRNDARSLLPKLCDLDDNSDPARLAALPEALADRLRQKYERARIFLNTRKDNGGALITPVSTSEPLKDTR